MEHDPGSHDPGSGETTGTGGSLRSGGPAEPDESAAAPTGEPRVDAALGGLDELGELPVSEHPAVYERVHEQLVEVLGELHPGAQNR